jgi:hypothetical protein
MIRALDVALSQLGIQEATGRNDGIPAARYMHGDKLAWCAGFCLFCNANSDDENVATSTAMHYKMRAVSGFIEEMQVKGRFFTDRTILAPNDFVFFANTDSDVGVAGNHMGIAETVDHESGIFTCIEGNYGNKVSRVVHSVSDGKIVGFARP